VFVHARVVQLLQRIERGLRLLLVEQEFGLRHQTHGRFTHGLAFGIGKVGIAPVERAQFMRGTRRDDGIESRLLAQIHGTHSSLFRAANRPSK
jgi:hypothetical protein